MSDFVILCKFMILFCFFKEAATQELFIIGGEIKAKKLSFWRDILMPLNSYFSGFEPPTDQHKWSKSLKFAQAGSQVLAEKMLKDIKAPTEFLSGDVNFKPLHKLVDLFIDKHKGVDEVNNYIGARSPITLIGYQTFEHEYHDGARKESFSFPAHELSQQLSENKVKFTRKFVGVGNMDENWGYLSTHILNRTASWGFTLSPCGCPLESRSSLEEIKTFLDDPFLIMLLVNQHHNVTHPKVVSLPRGIETDVARVIWDAAKNSVSTSSSAGADDKTSKDTLLFASSTTWGPRPQILECVTDNMGQNIKISTGRMKEHVYAQHLSSSMATLCLPGLGYDTFRVFEALAGKR